MAVLLAGVLAATGTVWFRVHSTRAFFDERALLSRFPSENALAVSVDVRLLRAAGLLGQSKSALEPDYKEFVSGTDFDYRRDLDSVVASFSRSGNYFIARGRFNWAQLRDYAMRQGGSCYRELCRVQGTRPDRHISFMPLRNDAIALAVSSNDLAATRLAQTGSPVTGTIPAAPVWISVPGSELRQQDALPPEMHVMLSALTNADRVVITFVPTAALGIEARMEATCRTQDDARVLASQLRSTTAMLREAVARDNKAMDGEVAAVLTAGSFDQTDREVTGRWPVRKSLIDALTAGI